MLSNTKQKRLEQLRKRHADLYLRHSVANTFIQTLLTDESLKNDPRTPDAINEYKTQLMKIDKKITKAEKLIRKIQGIPEPTPVVIGLKPGSLTGKALS